MAKLTSRTASGIPAEGDLSHSVDISDPTDNPLGTSKKLTITNQRKAILRLGEFTAYATGGQANATPLTAYKNNIITVVTTGDSVKLLPALEGVTQRVKNSGTNAMDLYPNTGDNFEGLAANIAISINAGQAIEFSCYSDTEYKNY